MHKQPGGGTLSRAGLGRIMLAPDILPIGPEALQKLPPDDVGIHIRNTGLRTAYGNIFWEVFVKVIEKNVFICSDDPSIVSFGKKCFELSKVYSRSEAPTLDGKPIHRPWCHPDDSTKWQAVI